LSRKKHTLGIVEARRLAADLRDHRLSALVADVRDWPAWKIRDTYLWLERIEFGAWGDHPVPFGEFIECREGIPHCRVCGCADDTPCAEGCEWVEPDLCSACRPAIGIRERPLLLSTPWVKALIARRKTETRRIAKIVPGGGVEPICPLGVPGDRLWVRETWGLDSPGTVIFRADWLTEEDAAQRKWKSSRFMPRSVSRIDLRVVETNLEPLHISQTRMSKPRELPSPLSTSQALDPGASSKRPLATIPRSARAPPTSDRREATACALASFPGSVFRTTWLSVPPDAPSAKPGTRCTAR
jgi:hypothetical protein